jgi:FMN reductase
MTLPWIMVKIVAFGGSLRPDSYSFHALQLAVDQVKALGAEVEVFNLRELNLPFVQQAGDYPDVIRLQEAVKAADALIVATPEYHGSVSGAVKNALDLMSFEHLSGKVVGLISVLGGQSNSNALNHLRLIFRWVHAWVIPEQISIGQAWNAFDEQGNIKDEKLVERLDKFARSLVENSRKLR